MVLANAGPQWHHTVDREPVMVRDSGVVAGSFRMGAKWRWLNCNKRNFIFKFALQWSILNLGISLPPTAYISAVSNKVI